MNKNYKSILDKGKYIYQKGREYYDKGRNIYKEYYRKFNDIKMQKF